MESSLRFKEFENKAYRTGEIGQFGTFYYGKGAPKSSISITGLNPVVRYGELYSTYNGLIDKVVSKTTVEKDNLKLSKGGEVLIPRVGERPLDFCLASYLPLKNIAIGEMISVYNTNEDGHYFTYYIRGKLKNIFARLVEGGNVSNLYFRYLAQVKINLPSLPEQKKIADFLSTVDKKIQALNKKKELLQSYKKGVMQKIFPAKGGQEPEIRFKQDDGGDYPEWVEKQVGSHVDYMAGFAFKGKNIVDDSSATPLMRGVNITEGKIRHTNDLDKFYNGSLDGMDKYQVRFGDIVISMDGSKVGRNSAIVEEVDDGALLVQRVARLREVEGSNIKFIYHHINSYRFHRYVDTVKTGAGIPHISSKQIQQFTINFPCIAEQIKIANFLTTIVDKINIVSSQIDKMKEWKKGLLQQMFV